jgi:hypothetical protein
MSQDIRKLRCRIAQVPLYIYFHYYDFHNSLQINLDVFLIHVLHFLGILVCRIRQVLTSCTIWHISLVSWCVRLDRFWHPVQSDTFPWYRNVSDCTGCQNLSNPTHQDTKEMCQIVQDVRTCLIWLTKIPRKCVRLYRMSEPV